MQKLAAILVLGTLVGLLCAPATAQYPERTATLISGFPAGGMVDIVARALAEGMKDRYPKGLVVLNRPGMGGAIAIGEVLRAKPDGYTITLAPKSALIIQPQLHELPYKSPDDVALVLNVVAFYSLMITRFDAPWKTPEEFVAAARAAPGRLRVGSPGEGTTPHLALEELKRKAKIDVIHVPFKGWAESSSALLGSHVDLLIAQPGELAALIEAKRIRPVGVFQPARNPFYPDTPTFKEFGHDVSAGTYFSLIAPKGTPPEVLRYIHDAAKEAMEQKAFADTMRLRIVEMDYRPGERLRAELMDEYRAHTELLRNMGMLKK
jgi:tripartite-type tricarboxylate transporter receptor subunit TctC